MATATAGYEWNHSGSSPLRSSPDTTSPMYPDRPIRPLPKRRLRARLSPEQVESIVYPPAPPTKTFNFLNLASESRATPRVERRRGESDHHACHCGGNHSEAESDEDEDGRGAALPSSPSYSYSRGDSSKGAAMGYPKPASTTSSADGYESFENTNNKKKRKIPNMGSTSTHHASLSAEMASMGISQTHDGAGIDEGDGPGRYYGAGPGGQQHQHQHQHQQAQSSAGTGISGAGRGRFGRTAGGRADRRVLGSSANAANAKPPPGALSNRTPGTPGTAGTPGPPAAPDHGGIISTAIANAQATPPPAGNENVSLLHREASKGAQPGAQFTFEATSNMVWPGQHNPPYPPQPPGAYPCRPAGPPPPAPPQHSRSAAPAPAPPNAQSAPAVNGAPHLPAAARTQQQQQQPNARGGGTAPGQQQGQQQQQQQGQQPPPPPKPRQPASRLYALAARRRRINQEYANLHSPPTQPWICEFCEYEDIFGEPPLALIRQYEIKDRKERKRLAEKKRLLEKARMKGRKGKKASKKAQNSANNARHSQNAPPGGYDQHPDDGSMDGPADDYLDQEYDDHPPQAAAPKAAGCDRPGCNQHHQPRPPGPGDPRVNTASATNGA